MHAVKAPSFWYRFAWVNFCLHDGNFGVSRLFSWIFYELNRFWPSSIYKCIHRYIYVYICIYMYIYTHIYMYIIYIYIQSQIPMGFRAAESIWLTYHSLYNADFRLAPSQWETSLQSNTVILTKLQRPLDTMGLFRCQQMLYTPTGILLMIVILYIRCSSDPCKTPVV